MSDMKIKVEIKNIKEIKAAFAKSPRIMGKNLSRAVNASALNIGRAAARITPVDTGRLRASILGGKFKGGEFTMAQSGFVGAGSTFTATVGTNVDYAVFVHEGTRFMRARPFMSNAVEFEQGFTDAEMERAVQKTLDEIARSAG